MITPPEALSILDDLLSRQGVNTRRAYLQDMNAFALWLKVDSPGHALSDLLNSGRIGARRMGEDYEQWMRLARSMALSTVNRRLSSLKSFVSAASRSGKIDWKLEVLPTRNVSTELKIASGRRDMSGPKPSQSEALFSSLRSIGCPSSARDLALVRILENPMLRRSEASSLNISDLDLTVPGHECVTVLGKGRNETEKLPLTPEVVSDLKTWLAFRGGRPCDPVFVRIRKDEKITAERLCADGIRYITISRGKQVFGPKSKRLNPHGLRHAGATKTAEVCAEQGIPVTEGMKLTRHKKAETFWGYVDRQGERTREIANLIAKRKL